MTSSSVSVLSAPSDACAVVMGYLQETSNKTGFAKNKEDKQYKQIKNSVYDVFAKIVIKEAVSSVIFLDIDGVVFNRQDGSVDEMASQLFPNQKGSWTDDQCDIAATHLFDKMAMANLRKLIFNTRNISIVLSSSWRENHPVPKLRELFAACFFSNFIIDKTPDYISKLNPEERSLVSSYSGRGEEIAYWLQKHPTITNFVILDDRDEGLSKDFREHFVKIDMYKLLTDTDIAKAREILDSRMTD